MSMTQEQALKLLEHPIYKWSMDWDEREDGLNYTEAIEIAIAALRPVSREQVEKVWSPCNFCAGAKYITGTVTAVCPVSKTRQQETLAEGDFDFCPVCGRPLTDEAVDMVLERLEAMHNDL